MTTNDSGNLAVNLSFQGATIKLQNDESLEAVLAGKSDITHTHSINQVTNLESRLVALEAKNPLLVDGSGNATLTNNLTCNDVSFVLNGEYVSLAGKIAPLLDNTSTTITHITLTEDEGVKVGYPVFATGEVAGKNYSLSLLDSTKCVPLCKSKGDTFLGVCTEVNCNVDGGTTIKMKNRIFAFTKFATHGDYLFHVADSSLYKLGDTIDYDGNKLDPESVLTLRQQNSIVGIVTSIYNSTTVAVFKV